MAILISWGARLDMDAMATALRGRGFDIIEAPDFISESPPPVEAILMLATGSQCRIVANIRQYRVQYPSAEIILAGTNHSDDEILCFIAAGARAIAPSRASLEDLVQTISSVLRSEGNCSERLEPVVTARIAPLAESQGNPNQFGRLTTREQEILSLVAAGLSNKEIGHQLQISVHTVKIHVHRILEKLRVRRRREAARWAISKVSHS